MAKEIFGRMAWDICKIIIDDAKMAEIMEAREFIMHGRWKGQLRLPVQSIYYGEEGDEWNICIMVLDNGRVDVVHDWYDGPQSFIGFGNLLDIADGKYVAPDLLEFILQKGWGVEKLDLKSFYKKASKEDIKFFNKTIMLKKMEGSKDEGS